MKLVLLPSNLQGNNKNTHLQSQQKLDSFLVFLHSMAQRQNIIC